MKKLYLLPLAALLIAAIPTDRAPEVAPQPAAEAPGHQVGICHTPGHDGDFVLAGGGGWCVGNGGNVLLVSRRACENGHDAAFTAGTPGANLSCDYDNEEMVRSRGYWRGN